MLYKRFWFPFQKSSNHFKSVDTGLQISQASENVWKILQVILWTSVQIWCNMYQRTHSPALLRWFSLQTKEGQRRSEFHLVGLENSEAASIKRTIGLVFGPFTALCISFLKRCTLTKKIWRALSSEATGSWSPLHMIVSQDSFGLWTWARVHTARRTAYFNGCPYNYTFIYNYITIFVGIPHFYDIPRSGWLLVLSLYEADYLQIFQCVSFCLPCYCS